ncbi:MAG: hypothetical protein KJN67_05585 [Pontiella sp.]|nr:hypothetical protein [Pontiella sp.]
MRTFALYMLILAATFGVVLAYRSTRTPSLKAAAVEVDPLSNEPAAPQEENAKPKPDIRAMLPAPPNPEPISKPAVQVPVRQNKPATPKIKPQPNPDMRRRRQAAQYWKDMAKRFEQQQTKLNRENDQNRRLNLIRSMAEHVRVDTLGTLDWAMSLLDPEEQRAALEAINKKALSGIGARIEPGQSGLPRIKETTILSAAASTGRVEPGDSISGMVTEDGSTISFKGRPIREVVRFLRGQPGTEIRLLMERVPTAGSIQPIPYDVLVQRSLIVMQPPF